MSSNEELNPRITRIDFPFIELNEIKIKLSGAEKIIAGLEEKARLIQVFLISPLTYEADDNLKYALGHYWFTLDYCQMIRELIAFGVERPMSRLSGSLAERKYPKDDPDALLGELHEASLQVEMIYSRIGIVERIVAMIEERIAGAEV